MYINSSFLSLAGNLSRPALSDPKWSPDATLVPRTGQEVTSRVETYQNHARIIQYQQTFYEKFPDGTEGAYLSPQGLTEAGVSHYILATIHVNEQPGDIRLNDHSYLDTRFDDLWVDVTSLQGEGVKVMGMIGGWQGGSFGHLSDESSFENYYEPLRRLFQEKKLDGMDLNIEVTTITLATIERIIKRLRDDFGEKFIITMAPVAWEMFQARGGYARFWSYHELESRVGNLIDFYNVQFYNSWGVPSLESVYFNNPFGRPGEIRDVGYADIAKIWPPGKIVMGTISHEGTGGGYWPLHRLQNWVEEIYHRYPNFGGVMGWERDSNDSTWAKDMSQVLRPPGWERPVPQQQTQGSSNPSGTERAEDHVEAIVRRWSSVT